MEKIEPVLWAFWKYDKFPYCLCGEVTKFATNQSFSGCVAIKGYGSDLFRPFLIVREEHGKELKDKLKQMEEEHWKECAELKKNHDKVLAEFWESVTNPLGGYRHAIKN